MSNHFKIVKTDVVVKLRIGFVRRKVMLYKKVIDGRWSMSVNGK
jgi:hypothetical protein